MGINSPLENKEDNALCEGNQEGKTILSYFKAYDVNGFYRKLIDLVFKSEDDESSLGKNWIPEKIGNPDSSTFDNQVLSLLHEISELKEKINKITSLIPDGEGSKNKEIILLVEELVIKERIIQILPRICMEARLKLLSDGELGTLFGNDKKFESVIVSIDIRRSTELMLKARNPELFSIFITELIQKLMEIVLSNFGVFDKFTGDGILAYFPKTYSGENAIIYALKSAEECHRAFDELYKKFRNYFTLLLKDVGLGIGIDFGEVTFVNISNELTVVGIPVVYACRMSGAKGGETLLNQPAHEELALLCVDYFKVTETELNIKNEGLALAYQVENINSDFGVLTPPKWTNKLYPNL